MKQHEGFDQEEYVMKWIYIILSCLVLLNIADAELSHLEMRVANDSNLREDYRYICTSINGVDFSSLPKPDVSLQELIDSAKDGDTKYIPSGYYSNTTTYHITKNLTLVGEGLVIVDARKNCEILHIENPFVTVDITNITFVNGNGSDGGAIDSIAKDLTLIDCVFFNNIADEGSSIHNNGGDLHIVNGSIGRSMGFDSVVNIENGALTLDNVSFANNSAFKFCNGINITITGQDLDREKESSYSIKDGDIDDYQLIVRNCTFSNNLGYATFGEFGGYCMKVIWASSANVLIENSEFESNTFEMGGAVISLGYCNTIVKNCTIHNNKVTEIGGSSAVSISGGNTLIENCDISENQLPIGFYNDIQRGAISTYQGANLIIRDCLIEGNKASKGAGIFNTGTSILENCTVYGNNATSQGGAIYNEGTLNINGSTISENQGEKGGAIYNEIGGVVKSNDHTLLKNNKAQDGGAIYNNGTIELKGIPKFVNNEAIDTGEDDYREGMGGAIFNAGNLTIENGVFTGNKAISGSSVWNEGNLTDTNSKYSSNYASAAGTIFQNQNTMILNNPTIVENVADQDGGGIYTSGFLVVNGGIMDDNVAKGQGGALYCIPGYSSTPVAVYLDGLNMRNNTASLDGGAICSSGKVVLEISNTGIAICVAGNNGGGVFLNAQSSIDLENSAIRNNVAKKGGGIYLTKGSTMTGDRNQVHDNKPDNIYQAK